jgi:predicted HTH transcriptional regulator
MRGKITEDKLIGIQKGYTKLLFLMRKKLEFLADVTSFANSNGGTIFYGIEAKDGQPISMDGFEISNLDKFKLRIEEILKDNIKPRIDFNLSFIELSTKKNYFL